MNETRKKTVSLVLGAGGARGLVHIGVIQWLLENDYEIRSIAGSSMGALIGGIYASGKLDVYTEWVSALQKLEVVRLLDVNFGLSGFFKGERIIGVLRELIGDIDMESLPIDFTAVAMELESGKEIWLREGNLFDAIRASIAIPLIFTPVYIDGRVLVDGGLVNPVPIAPTLNDPTDMIIAVNLGGRNQSAPEPVATPPKLPAEPPSVYRQRIRNFIKSMQTPKQPPTPIPGMIDVALHSMEAMENTIARLKLAAYSPDATIEVARNACRMHEFWRAEEMIALGRKKASEIIPASQQDAAEVL